MIVRVPLSVSVDLADWEVRHGSKMSQGQIRRAVKADCIKFIEREFLIEDNIHAEGRLFYINEGKRK